MPSPRCGAGREVDRLGEVVVEAGVAAAAAVFFPAVAADGDDAAGLRAACRSRRMRATSKPVMPGSPRSSMTTSGLSACTDCRAAGPSKATRTLCPCRRSSLARLSAASTLSSTTRTAPTAGNAGCVRTTRPALAAATATGRRTVNSLPRPGPVAGGLDRAAVHLDQPLHQRQPDAQAALRAVERAIDLREEVEHLGQHLRGNADAGVAHAEHRLLPFPRRGNPDRAALRRVLGGVVEQVGEHLRQPGLVGVDAQRLARDMPPSSWWLPASISGRLVSTALLHDCWPARGICSSRRILPRVMRDTSSRSSTSRTRCVTWRSITSLGPEHVGLVLAAAGAARQPRCGSAPADCAARGPASRGTRSSAGRRARCPCTAGRCRGRSPARDASASAIVTSAGLKRPPRRLAATSQHAAKVRPRARSGRTRACPDRLGIDSPAEELAASPSGKRALDARRPALAGRFGQAGQLRGRSARRSARRPPPGRSTIAP